MSLFVFRGRLTTLQNFCKTDDVSGLRYAVIRDYETGQEYSVFGGDGSCFFSAFCENDRVYCLGTCENRVYCYVSDDLLHWHRELVLTFPETFALFNTAVCRDDHGYMMAVEVGGRTQDGGRCDPAIGTAFTTFFARSMDMSNWELLPFDKCYTPNRYNACPALEYVDGYYYMICLEALPLYRYAPYLYRTRDFDTWEIGLYNPLFIASEEDLHPKAGVVLTPEEEEACMVNVNANNSDVDLCEFEGKTYILYCSGNQGVTWGGMYCEAVCEMPLRDYLLSNFDEEL